VSQEGFEGKVAIVTGATDGIGRVVIEQLVGGGARALAVARRAELGERLVDELGAEAVTFVAGDVAEPFTAERAVSAALERFGDLHVLVNNAALDLSELPLTDTEPEQMRTLLEVNVLGTLLMMRACAPAMRPGAAVVNVSSRLAHIGLPGSVVYSATKGAVESLSRGAALEWAERGIRVNCVAPGLTETPMVTAWLEAQPDPQAFRAAAEKTVPLGRFSKPAEVAAAILFLASDAASAITGTSLLVDGGYTAA
jgi:NAD(P)-dependent dehydrogenase (short-subunit alcohol dehydrogenase family)